MTRNSKMAETFASPNPIHSVQREKEEQFKSHVAAPQPVIRCSRRVLCVAGIAALILSNSILATTAYLLWLQVKLNDNDAGAGSATNTVCSNPCGLACYGAGDDCFQNCYSTCSLSTTIRTGVLSPYLSLNAIQHVGV